MLKHSFSDETKGFYLTHDLLECGSCGSRCNELHHILGRRHEENASIFNSFPVCRRCHNRHDIHSKETQKDLLNKTADILYRYQYELKQIDIKFIKIHHADYELEILRWNTIND